MKKKILSFLASPDYVPMTRLALFKTLGLNAKQQREAKVLLEEMIKLGKLFLKESKLYYKVDKKPTLIQGMFRMNPRGFGFVIPKLRKQYPEDIFIPKHLTNTAVDGDEVEIEAYPSSKKDKGPEGKIVCILKRGRAHLAGTVCSINSHGDVFLYSPFLGANKTVKTIDPEKKLHIGDRVIVKVIEWGGQNKSILSEVIHKLGSISDPSIDVKAAVEEFRLRSDFPPEAIEEAKAFGKQVGKKDYANRLNLTKLESFTIDPNTAKDFDDALSLSKDKSGHYHLGVHIADVAHYVKPGSHLDKEAVARSNSTYFPGSCIPMLPEELSNNLCSLKPGVVRLCVSVLMTFNAKGDLLHHDIQRSVIKSQKRFTYEEAKQVLDGKKKSKHLPTLQLMLELCLLLKKKRSERGSIDFALPEVVLDIDSKGNPTSYHIVEYDVTHQLVEEYMLKANEITAKVLSSHGLPLLFRIHEQPSEETMEEFFALARSLGFFLPPKPKSKDVQKLFEQAKATHFEAQLSVAFIRSMKLASYSPENVGHFGLCLEEYCHFTSPIRRYPDLIIQRQLFGELPPECNLTHIAEMSSDKERLSFKAEQTVKTLKKLRLLSTWHANCPDEIYHCTISKIKPFGFYFELAPLGVEGFLHVSELGEDYFIHEESKNALLGTRSHVRFCVGDSIPMQIEAVDLILLEVKWTRVVHSSGKKRKHKKERHSK
jgi:ribonuclease R